MNVTTEEGWHTLTDGFKLYTKTWKPASAPPRAILVFVHGFSDHCNTYPAFFNSLADHSIQSFAYDQRGWGRSVTQPSQRGLTGPTALVLDDLTSILRSLLPSPVPLFLMGHSMGGAEVLHYAARGPDDVRRQITGYLLESPWIALHKATQPSRALEVAGKLVAKVFPRLQMVQHVQPQWVSRDEEVVRAYIADELCHDTGTLEGLAGCLARAAELHRGTVAFHEGDGKAEQCRIWLAHGTADRVTSFEASEKFMESLTLRDMEFKVYDGWYHKLHAEPGEDKITFAKDVAQWVLARTAAPAEQRSSDSQAKSKL